MLFKDITVLDADFKAMPHYFLGVRDSRIAYVGTTMPEGDWGEIYDGRDKAVMPAFYNAHTHLPMSLMRGYGENLTLNDWLNTRIFPFEDKISNQDAYYSALLGIGELLRFGTVSATDMYFFGEAMLQAVEESGIKVNFGRGLAAFGEDTLANSYRFTEARALYEKWHNSCAGRVKIDFALHAEYTSTDLFAEQLGEFLSSSTARFQVHVSETAAEVAACQARHGGLTPPAYLAEKGLLNARTTAAHCVALAPADFEILRAHGVTVATCPASNLKLASGFADLRQMQSLNMPIALGTDSAASNNNLDIWKEIKLLALLHKGKTGDPTLLTPRQILQMATVNGALSQGREDCGVLREGAAADLQVINLAVPNMTPCHDLAANLVYAADGGDVLLTMCDGRVLYRDGNYLTLDMERIIYEVNQRARSIAGELAK